MPQLFPRTAAQQAAIVVEAPPPKHCHPYRDCWGPVDSVRYPGRLVTGGRVMKDDEFMAMLESMFGGRPTTPDPHAHQCPKCGHIWKHDRMEIAPGDRANTQAHSCPKCSYHASECYNRYKGVVPLEA